MFEFERGRSGKLLLRCSREKRWERVSVKLCQFNLDFFVFFFERNYDREEVWFWNGKESGVESDKKSEEGGYIPTNHPRDWIINVNLLRAPQITHHDSVRDQQRQKPEKSQGVDTANERSGYVSRKESAFLVLSLLLLMLGWCTFRWWCRRYRRGAAGEVEELIT